MRDLSHYGDPPTPPRDETRVLRIIARVVLAFMIGFGAAALAVTVAGGG